MSYSGQFSQKLSTIVLAQGGESQEVKYGRRSHCTTAPAYVTAGTLIQSSVNGDIAIQNVVGHRVDPKKALPLRYNACFEPLCVKIHPGLLQ